MSNIAQEISAEIPDWSREAKGLFEWCPSKSLLASIRAYQRNKNTKNPLRIFWRWVAVYRYRFWSVITGSEISINARLGGGLLLTHPTGVVIAQSAIIGANCLIFQQVTIAESKNGQPTIVGGHVDIGAGAKILPGVKLGNHCKIGANAVVVKDVPSYATAVGVPAKNLLQND